jgi:hypothetical protein
MFVTWSGATLNEFPLTPMGVLAKDELYAGYCGAIPIPGCWYWYYIGDSQKSAMPNT